MNRFIRSAICFLAIALMSAGCGQSNRITNLNHTPVAHAPGLALLGVPAGVPSQTVPLMADRTNEIGSVSVWLDHGQLIVQYATVSPWVLDATHLAVAASVAGIATTPSGNPAVGRFPYGDVHSPAVSQFTYTIDLAAAGLDKQPWLCLAAQADVSRLSATGGVLASAGAWAQGETFDPVELAGSKGKGQGGNWAMNFAVDMNKLRGLLLWNKLGSAYEVQHSVAGPNGVIVGDLSYVPCKYGNGFEAPLRTGDHNIPNNYIDFPGLNLGPRGCMEFWFLPDWSNYEVGTIVDVFWYGIPNTSPQVAYLAMQYNDWQEKMNISASAGNNGGVATFWSPPSTPGWSTTTPFHVALTWDTTLPTASDRLKVFLNGTPYGSMTVYGDANFTPWSANAVLRLASRLVSGDWNRHNWDANHMVIDNLKIWSFPKTDFSDRFTE